MAGLSEEMKTQIEFAKIALAQNQVGWSAAVTDRLDRVMREATDDTDAARVLFEIRDIVWCGVTALRAIEEKYGPYGVSLVLDDATARVRKEIEAIP